MENNFIQMAASADHAVAYTWSIVCSCILQMVSRKFSFKTSIVSGLSA